VNDRIRFGLIGAGGMANSVHYPSLAEMADVELAALCDLVPEKLAKTAERFGIRRTFSDHRQMLGQVEIDAVYLLMPPHHLFDLAITCLRQKKHLFIEKPPGVSYEQARMMALEAQRNGVVAMCGFNRRYIPLITRTRAMVEERGGIRQCVATFYKRMENGPAYYDGAIDILSCDTVHAVDMLRWMGGEPRFVVGDVARQANVFDDRFNALIRFESGAAGVLLANWAVGGRVHQFEMHGPGISVFVNPDDCALILRDGRSEPEVLTTREAAGSDETRHYYGFAAEARHFVDCIREGREPSSSLADAAKTMRLVNQIYAHPIDPAAPRWAGG
jgi:predicted dehydrogenase